MRKTLIGVLASRDSVSRNDALARLLETLYASYGHLPYWTEFAFAFSGGTYERVVAGVDESVRPVNEETWNWLHNTCGILQLPEGKKHGGGILLGCLVARGMIPILWPFFSPATSHWLHPESLALLRLADLLSVSTFMNAGSVLEWASISAQRGVDRDPVPWPPTITLEGTGGIIPIEQVPARRGTRTGSIHKVIAPIRQTEQALCYDVLDEGTPAVIALIAHDQKKDAMKAFVEEYERQLHQHFSRILCTGTTGQVVTAAAPSLEPLVYRYRSGPMGGDLEIATEVLFGTCHVVVFFTDPLRPHPHADDIRSVFGACMRQDQVRMFSNERQTRRWFDERFGV